ncbi:MAG TPA: hypothetical protein VGP97_02700 [Burkholderiales bacterium]|nr:hypothetical protein [Burkholderiales bacterium]
MIPLLWTLLALFVLRVAGQALVAFWGVPWLPPMERWYSGLMPYPLLLPAQLAIIVLMARICSDFTRRWGFFVRPRRFFAVHWLWFGWIYLAGMVLRFLFQGPTIPVFFHWVLAAFVIAVGLWHRGRLRA